MSAGRRPPLWQVHPDGGSRAAGPLLLKPELAVGMALEAAAEELVIARRLLTSTRPADVADAVDLIGRARARLLAAGELLAESNEEGQHGSRE